MVTAFRNVVAAVMALIVSGSLAAAAPADLKTLEIGAKAPDFKLPGVDGRTYTLSDFADAKILAVVFTCNHCPTAQAYEERLLKMHADYKDRGVALVAISPNDAEAVRLDELGYTDLGDSLEDMKIRAKDRKFAFPYLYDGETQKTSAAYGVLATPHVYIFDRERKLRYVGRVDDSEVKTVKSHDARNAIEALLAGKPVPVEKTRVFGCSTKWADKREDAKKSLAKWNAEEVSLKPIDERGVAELVQNRGDKYLLVNLWATWCAPCVVELSDFVTMNRMYRGRNFQLVTLNLDDIQEKDAVLKVLRERHVSSSNYIVDMDDRDRFAEVFDKEWPGPLPHTILIAPGGKVVYRATGETDPLEIKRAIVEQLGRTYASKAPAKSE
jgi:peroxiredoxin